MNSMYREATGSMHWIGAAMFVTKNARCRWQRTVPFSLLLIFHNNGANICDADPYVSLLKNMKKNIDSLRDILLHFHTISACYIRNA